MADCVTSWANRNEVGDRAILSILIDMVDQDNLWHTIESAVGTPAFENPPRVVPVVSSFLLLERPFRAALARTIQAVSVIIQKTLSTVQAILRANYLRFLGTGPRAESGLSIGTALFGHIGATALLAALRFAYERLALILRKPQVMAMNEASAGIEWLLTAPTSTFHRMTY